MSAPRLAAVLVQATDGAIAVVNLQSSLDRAWSRFWQVPLHPGRAECVVELELLNAQFLGELGAYERIEELAAHLSRMDPGSARTALIEAQVASSTHRFEDARRCLTRAASLGTSQDEIKRRALSIEQACGHGLDAVLKERRRLVSENATLEAQVPLGALLAESGEFDEADEVYREALAAYRDVSPFAPAWVCFQLGFLWGEQVASPEPDRAIEWYRAAIEYLPGYVKARVHLSELLLDQGHVLEAEGVLLPAMSSNDPEVYWRLADVAAAMGRQAQARFCLETATEGFERLLAAHPLAFADHAAEFFRASGNDVLRAFELAKLDLANRPTLRAFETAHAASLEAGQHQEADLLRAAARRQWASLPAFRWSPLRGNATSA